MRFPGTRLPAVLLLLSLAAHRCLAADEAGPTAPLNAPQKTSNSTIMKHSVTDFSTSMDEKVVVDQPTTIVLSCELSSDVSTVDVMWKHDEGDVNKTDFTFNKTDKWQTWYKFDVRDSRKLGNYTCVFKTAQEARATFHVKVPSIKGGEKPMVSYERDTVVMKCDSAKHLPVSWIWYRIEGDDKVAINDSLMASKYEVTRKKLNETKLHIKVLSGNDTGSYWCEAVYPIGVIQGKIKLSVLSYMVPLKPFLAIAAEVVVLVALILLYEMHSKKKQKSTGADEKETEQTEHLKSEDANGAENETTRHRKV